MRSFLVFLLVSSSALAQQSLFNVPSAELTPPRRTFVQEQFNVSEDGVTLNSVFAYGLIPHLEVGVDLLNLTAKFQRGLALNVADELTEQALSPLAAASALTVWEVTPWWRAGAGALVGTNIAGRFAARLAAFGYVQNVFQLGRIKFFLGAFLANAGFVGGEGSTANFMLGLDVEITPRLHFVGDHIHGIHDLGVSVPGFAYSVTKRFVVSAGVQLPNARAADPFGGVLELTFLPDES